jgi:hypothetical protein
MKTCKNCLSNPNCTEEDSEEIEIMLMSDLITDQGRQREGDFINLCKCQLKELDQLGLEYEVVTGGNEDEL